MTTNKASFAAITETKTETKTETNTVTNVLDTNISASAYGNPIPLLYGTMLLATNVIWTTGIIEVVETVTTTKVETTTSHSALAV